MKVGYKGPVVSPGGFPAPCLKTGQTVQYNSKEDDGYYEKGWGKSYTIMTTGNYSGTSAIVLNAKTHNLSNNCVLDNRTGLMWVRTVPTADIGPDSDGKLLGIDDTNDEDIYDFKDQADTKTLGGHADWRVPNIVELLTLVDHGANTPAADTTTFPSLSGLDFIWSSTTVNRATTYGKTVYLLDGDVVIKVKTTGKHYAMLVRGGR